MPPHRLATIGFHGHVQDQEYAGVVKYISEEKGYGFIESQELWGAWVRRQRHMACYISNHFAILVMAMQSMRMQLYLLVST